MEDNDILEVWVHNPYTKQLLAKTIDKKAKAFDQLLRLCHESPDPNVRAGYMLYMQLKTMEDTLKGK